MKISVDVDCTPAEARQFFGLPDLAPMQASVMAEVEKRILREVERFSPDAVLQKWLAGFPEGAEWLKGMFGALGGGTGRPDKK